MNGTSVTYIPPGGFTPLWPSWLAPEPADLRVEVPGPKVCSVEGCGKPVRARGWCSTHYARVRARGTPDLAPRKRPLADRFWEKVRKAEEDGCWEWTAYRDPNGYGQIGRGGKSGGATLAHRASWELHNGPIPAGLFVCHRCDNPGCVRPDHLFLGTHEENMADMDAKGRRVSAPPRGVAHYKALLNETVVEEARARYAVGDVSLKELGLEFGVTLSTMQRAIRGNTYADVTAPPTSKKRSRSRLSAETRAMIRAEYAGGGLTQHALSMKYGVGQSHISRIISGARCKSDA